MTQSNALAAIKAADLSAPTYRTARELLDIAARQKGVTRISMGLLCEIAVTKSESTARRHLIDLRAAEILKYTIDGDEITVSFSAWPVITQRAYTRVQRAADMPESTAPAVENDLPDDHPARMEDHSVITQDHPARGSPMGATNGSHTHAQPLVGWLDQPIPTNGNGSTKQPTKATNHSARVREAQPPPEPKGPQPTAPDERTVNLLIAVGIEPPKARELVANGCDLDEALRQIARWQPDFDAGKAQTGLLIHRIEKRSPAPEPPAAFKQTALYRDFAPRWVPGDVEFYSPEPTPDAPPESSPAGAQWAPPVCAEPPPPSQADARDNPAVAWQVLLRDLRHSGLSEPYTTPLYAARLEPIGDVDGLPGYHVVLAADADLHTMQNRMISWVRRELGSIFGKRCYVEFAAEAAP